MLAETVSSIEGHNANHSPTQCRPLKKQKARPETGLSALKLWWAVSGSNTRPTDLAPAIGRTGIDWSLQQRLALLVARHLVS